MNHNTGMRRSTQCARQSFTIATTCFSAFIILLAISSPQGMFSQSGATTGDPQRGKELFEKGRRMADDAADLFERGRRIIEG